MMNWLLAPPSVDDFIRLLRAWRLWVIGTLLGALFGVVLFFLLPPSYRAQATVIVDFNLEESWPYEETDRKMFFYLERETRKLEEIAWSDETIDAISQGIGNITVADLRNERLHLSQPQDGGWHFYADDPDPVRAAQIASLWAENFSQQVQQGAAIALELHSLQAALESGTYDTNDVQARILQLEQASLGISPFVQTYQSQKDALPFGRKTALGEYMVFGAASILLAVIFFVLFFGQTEYED